MGWGRTASIARKIYRLDFNHFVIIPQITEDLRLRIVSQHPHKRRANAKHQWYFRLTQSGFLLNFSLPG